MYAKKCFKPITIVKKETETIYKRSSTTTTEQVKKVKKKTKMCKKAGILKCIFAEIHKQKKMKINK